MITISIRASSSGILSRIPDYSKIVISSDRAEEILWISWAEFNSNLTQYIAAFITSYHNNPYNWSNWETRTY